MATPIRRNGRYQIFSASAGGTADFVTNGLFFDETTTFASTDIAVGDEILDALGNRYTVAVINTTAPLNLDVTDVDASGNVSAGAGMIYDPTSNYSFEIATRVGNNVTEFIHQHAMNAASELIDSQIKTNADAIGTNATNIGTNTTNIGTNAGNISTNTGNIGTNTGNIGTNSSAIDTLQDATTNGWDNTLVGGVDYSQTAPSTSSITMSVDHTSRIKVGYPVRYKFGGTFRYGVVKTISSILLTVYGAPLLTTASGLQDLEIGVPTKVMQATYVIAGNYDVSAETELLENITNSFEFWHQPAAYLVRFANISKLIGATPAVINVGTGATGIDVVSTSNGSVGVTTSASLVTTEVDINLTNYKIDNGDRLEIRTSSGTGDSENLTVICTFVYE